MPVQYFTFFLTWGWIGSDGTQKTMRTCRDKRPKLSTLSITYQVFTRKFMKHAVCYVKASMTHTYLGLSNVNVLLKL